MHILLPLFKYKLGKLVFAFTLYSLAIHETMGIAAKLTNHARFHYKKGKRGSLTIAQLA